MWIILGTESSHRVIMTPKPAEKQKLRQMTRAEAGVEGWDDMRGSRVVHHRKTNPPGGGDESISRFALRLEIFWLRPSGRNLNLL